MLFHVQVEYLPLCHGCPALSPPTHGYVRITPIEDISSPNIGKINQRDQQNKLYMYCYNVAEILEIYRPLYVSFLSGSLINSRSSSNINSTSNYKATYSCQEGFMLTQGDRVRTCGVLGDWRGRQPLCRCNFIIKYNSY